MTRNIMAALLLLLLSSLGHTAETGSSLCSGMGITVAAGRVFFFTNKESAFYYAPAKEQFADGWMGLTADEQRIFNDYELFSSNGKPFRRQDAAVTVYPHRVVREFPGGITEEFFMADGGITLGWKITGTEEVSIVLSGYTGTKPFSAFGNGCSAPLQGVLNNRVAVFSPDGTGFITAGENRRFLVSGSGNACTFSFSVVPEGVPLNDVLLQQLLNNKEERINRLLEKSRVTTGNTRFDKAYLWICANLDALITRQGGMDGIYAGLPWFNNYWGRDTFISLPGATYTQGNFAAAKAIIESFASHQLRDTASQFYGRVPNRVTLGEKIYNTTDGTPRLAIEAWNTFLYSGDKDFLRSIYPMLLLAAKGTLTRFTDTLGFLVHADAETWMDAVGGNGPWSPRGNRANDIQALWYRQLLVTAEAANYFGDTPEAVRFTTAAETLRKSFMRYFYGSNGSRIADRLTLDGRRDTSARPNAFFVLNEPDLVPGYTTALQMLARATRELVYPYGVLSLGFDDPNFHPFHENPPYYVKDAAYHNGTIWQWNTGPVVQALTGFGFADTAWRLTDELMHQALGRGGVGCIAELSDALPRPGSSEPKLSGTFVQAWSHAEFIRNIYQDYLGVKVDMAANAVYFIPRMPKALPAAEFRVYAGNNTLLVRYEINEQRHKITITAAKADSTLDIGIALLNYAGANFQLKTSILRDEILEAEVPSFSRDTTELYIKRNGSAITVTQQVYLDPAENSQLYADVHLAVPLFRNDFNTLKGPSYELLPHSTIKAKAAQQKSILRANDNASDEQYLYPLNPAFKKGILDLRQFSIAESDSLYHFTIGLTALHNPGWHNEYGFQLTYISILLGGANGITDVGKNSRYQLPAGREFVRQINAGGGVEVVDNKGKTLAAYLPVPADITNTLGSTKNGQITFALPKRITGKITPATVITVLCGAQDDHGGAGVGEFRLVTDEPAEWSGGGKKSTGGSNVYDILTIN